MTTLADIETRTRRKLKDAPKTRVDKMSGDASSTVFDLGKDIGLQTNTESVTVGGAAVVRGVDYTMGPAFGVTDYENGQIAFKVAPAAGANNVVVTYRECVYRSELIWDEVNAARRMLYPKFYASDVATITITNLKRDYQLDSADVNEAPLRAIFALGENAWRILNARKIDFGTTDQFARPFRRFETFYKNGHPMLHTFPLLGVSDTLRLQVMHAFTPLTDPGQTLDVPEACEELLVLWATSMLALKMEPIRGRMDNAQTQQGTSANPPGTMALCVPVDAEILTRDGFRRFDEITVGQDVLAYDTATDSNRWTPLRKVSVFKDQATTRMRSRSMDVVFTPEHKWALRIGDSGMRRELVKATEFPKYASHRYNAIIMAAPSESGVSDLTPHEAALIGWIVTDGYIRHQGKGGRISGAAITQSKQPYVDEIRGLVNGIAHERVTQAPPRTFPGGQTYATLPGHTFEIRAKVARRLFERAGIHDRSGLPALVTRLSHEARAAMLDAMLKAEAHTLRKGNRSGRTARFGQKNPHVIEAFQILCAMEGRALGRPASVPNYPGFIYQVVRSNRYSNIYALRMEEGPTIDVWCPTTDLGTWVMRWNNQVMITGNTSEDFELKWMKMRDALPSSPPIIEMREIPLPFEAGLVRT